MGLSTFFGSSNTSIPSGYELSSFCLFSLPCVRSRESLQSFLIILGPDGFPHERIAMKQQSRSLAERSWGKLPIVVIINIKSAFKRASRIDLTLHLSQHDSHR